MDQTEEESKTTIRKAQRKYCIVKPIKESCQMEPLNTDMQKLLAKFDEEKVDSRKKFSQIKLAIDQLNQNVVKIDNGLSDLMKMLQEIPHKQLQLLSELPPGTLDFLLLIKNCRLAARRRFKKSRKAIPARSQVIDGSGRLEHWFQLITILMVSCVLCYCVYDFVTKKF